MSNLLDRSSLVLTPTAYNNGEALCIKPDDGSGDFQFSRNSAATRVNAQGLVENVQILSSNLVQNGSFSEEGVQEVSNGSFSQEGVQLITNGSFDTDSDWTKLGSWTIENGKLTTTGGASLVYQNITSAINKTYKVVFEVSNYVSGEVTVGFGGALINPRGEYVNANGIYTQYLTKTDTNQSFGIKPNNFIGSIDNVSVREVGQDWSLGTGWSIGEDKVVTVTGAGSKLIQTNTLSGKTCKVTLTVSDYGGTSLILVDFGSTSSSYITSNGTHTVYGTYDQDNFEIYKASGFSGSITNISVKEVGQNWEEKSGFIVSVDSSGLVFDNSTGNATAGVFQNIGLSDSKKYRMTATMQLLTGASNGKFALQTSTATGSGQSLVYLGETLVVGGDAVTETFEFTPALGDVSVQLSCSEPNATFKISNISVIEITTDTSLPRINYEGFSYQDALGSELITNGDFATDSDWTKGTGITISNGQANFTGVSGQYLSQDMLTSGKSYKLTFNVTDYTSGTLTIFGGSGNNISSIFPVNSTGIYTGIFISGGTNNRLYFGSTFIGSIDNVSVKEYLGQSVVPDSGCGSWLWEPQSTNLITQSELFSDASWAKLGNSSFGFVTGIAPNGATSVYEITSDGGGGKLQYTISGLAINTEYTLSFYAKKESDITLVQSRILSLTGGSGGTNLTTVNYQNDLITDQWVRITHTFTTNDTLGNYILYISNALTSGDTLQLWGAQVEALSYATSYIPTSGSTVTRNQDVCNNGATGTGLINSTEGVLYAEIAALSDNGNCQFGLFGNSTSQQLRLEISNSIIRAQLFNGAYQANMSSTQVVTNNNKIAFKYKENDFALWVNGVEVATDTIGVTFNPNELIKFNLTAQNNTSIPFFGKVKSVITFNTALTDEELECLTTI